MGLTLYQTLIKIKEGETFDKYQLNDIDENVVEVKYINKKNPTKNIIFFDFTPREYFKLFYINDKYENAANYCDYVLNYDINITDHEQTYNDWDEGYNSHLISKDNQKKYIEIVKHLFPTSYYGGKKEFNEIFSETSEKLRATFERQISYILDEMNEADNDCRRLGILNAMETQTCDVLADYGILRFGDRCYKKYFTTVQILLNMYEKSVPFATELTLSELLTRFIDKQNISVDDFEGYQYDYWCGKDEYNQTHIDNVMSEKFDEILETFDDSEYFSNLYEFKKLLEILQEYPIGSGFHTPKSNKNILFTILDADPQTNKLRVRVKLNPEYASLNDIDTNHELRRGQIRQYTYEGFMNFLNSQELFDY